MSPTEYAAEPPDLAKDTVRRRLRQLRRARVPERDLAADAEEIELAGLHAAHGVGVRPGDWVAAYESMPGEPPTQGLIGALTARGIRVMVPITQPDWTLDWREVGGVGAGAGAEPGTGAQSALGPDAIQGARVVFVPAHGVDAAGTRIGQGKGCYDRTLPRATGRIIAIVHPWEVLAEVLPRDHHDQPVDGVIAAGLGLQARPT